MDVLFCRPDAPQEQEDGFELEAEVADAVGMGVHRISMEPVVDGDVEAALAPLRRRRGKPKRLVLRTWIFTEEEYSSLYDGLLDRGYRLVTSPAAYAAALYVPNYHPLIAAHSPPAAWIWGTDLDEAWATAETLGPPPWIVKDHVKSAKEEWGTACIVPEGATRAEFDDVCRALVEHRGDRFERGLVFKKLVPIRALPDPTTRVASFEEYRLFFWRGALIDAVPYYEVGGAETEFSRFSWLGDTISSPLFTADVAHLEDGSWTIIELNDGGISFLPPLADPRALYEAFATPRRG